MKTSLSNAVVGVLVLLMLVAFSQAASAQEITPLTLEKALEQAFAKNTSHSLFLWEQELINQREVLKKHPQLSAQLDPAGISNGQWQAPQGRLNVSMPLGQSLDLTGTVSMELDRSGVAVNPAGSLRLEYEFFAGSEAANGGFSAEESMQRQANALVLQTVDLLLELQRQLDLVSYEEGRLQYLEASLYAAQLTPDYDDLPLRREVREQVSRLAALQEELDQLQLRLAGVLGTAESVVYEPVLTIGDLNIPLPEDELGAELFASDSSLRQAQAELVRLQEELELERKTRGWDVKASGFVGSDAGSDPGIRWDLSLSASKILYPRNIVLQELELAAAKAEYALAAQQSTLENELRIAIQTVQSAKKQVELGAEHLAEVQEDWSLRQRQYQAGLVTELQLEEARLALQKTESDLWHNQLLHARSILALWNLAGRDLRVFVFDLIH